MNSNNSNEGLEWLYGTLPTSSEDLRRIYFIINDVLLKIDTIYKTSESIYTDSCIEIHVDGFKFPNHYSSYEDKYNITYRYIVISNLPDDVLDALRNEPKYDRFNFKQVDDVGTVIYEGDEKYSFIKCVMELCGYKSGSRNVNIFGGRL